MYRLTLLTATLALSLGLAACSGSSSPLSTPDSSLDANRLNQELPPGAGVDDACVALYDVLITVPPEFRDEVGDLNGQFRLNACPPAGSAFDALMTLRAIERGESLTLEGVFDPAAAIPTYNGTKIIDRQEDDKGRNILWTMSAGITTSSVAPPRVDGTLDRMRTRWMLDKDGNRIERTDTIHLTFSGLGIPAGTPGAGGGGQPGDDNGGGGQGTDDGPGHDAGDDHGGHGGDDGPDDDEDDHGGHGNDDGPDDDED